MHLTKKLLYASGAFSFMLSRGAVSAHAQFLYTDLYQLKPELVSLGWTAFTIGAAISEPLIAYFSSKVGRIPMIRAAVIPWILSHYFMWVPPAFVLSGSDITLVSFFALTLMVNGICEAIVGLCYSALLSHMFPDEDERVSVAAMRNTAAVIGVLISIPLPPLIAGAGWGDVRLTGVVMASLLLSFTLCMPILFESDGDGKNDKKGIEGNMFKQILSTFSYPNFSWFMFSNVTAQVALSLTFTSFSLMSREIIKLNSDISIFTLTLTPTQQTAVLTTTMYISSITFSSHWSNVAKRMKMKATWQRGLLFLCGGLVAQTTFSFNNFYIAFLLIIVLGFTVSPHMLIRELLLLDIIAESDKSLELVFMGTNGLLMRFASMLQGLILGSVLSVCGYVPGVQTKQPTSVLYGTYALFNVIPIVFLLIAYFGVEKVNLKKEKKE